MTLDVNKPDVTLKSEEVLQIIADSEGQASTTGATGHAATHDRDKTSKNENPFALLTDKELHGYTSTADQVKATTAILNSDIGRHAREKLRIISGRNGGKARVVIKGQRSVKDLLLKVTTGTNQSTEVKSGLAQSWVVILDTVDGKGAIVHTSYGSLDDVAIVKKVDVDGADFYFFRDKDLGYSSNAETLVAFDDKEFRSWILDNGQIAEAKMKK